MTALATGDETLNRNVAKLTVENYFSWTLKVKQELRTRNNVIALAIIFKYVGENFEGDIADIESTKEAWAKLEELCNDGGLVNGAINLKQLPYHVKPKDMKHSRLHEFTECQVTGMVIGNLNEEYASYVPSLEADMKHLSLSKVKARLLTGENRRKLQKCEEEVKHNLAKRR
ncbi:hypothetical protein PR048_020345 [Dryococelus australis]|uniref:Gag protein n=1 Tax=Dryococelus australis TaxID=614101 RepID=A0ABQ9H617_9NEOP|nr:hypothetical protein PR048_020345 [Dryococelus australis]